MQTQAQSNYLNRSLATNFKAREFVCPCCKAEGITDKLVFHLQAAHDLLPDPAFMIITSGYRCVKENTRKGYSLTSSHLKGAAVDIKCEESRFRFYLINALLDAGFRRIGIGKDFIHADMDTEKYQDLIWNYYEE